MKEKIIKVHPKGIANSEGREGALGQEQKICKQCNSNYVITDKDLEFLDKLSPKFNKKKISIQAPSLCYDCRQKRRLCFRNERKLYKRKCDATGKQIISTISPDKPYKVYDNDFWWSDKWDIGDYSLSFSFKENFFDQFKNLMLRAPRFALTVFESENCNYNNFLGKSKNCYYSFGGGYLENVYYTYWCGWDTNIFDSFYVIKSENIYYGIDTINCFNSIYLYGCDGCSNSAYLKDCSGCSDCIACIGLKNKQYYIGNKKYSKKDYFLKKEELSNKEMLNIYNETYKKSIFPNFSIFNSLNSTGEYIKNSKNLINGYICELTTDSKNIFWGFELDNCLDIDLHNNSNKIYEIISGGFCYNTLFSIFPFESNNLLYCDNCFSCSNCFGCVGLNHKNYCILNKQYTKDEYNNLVPKIIEHMSKTGEWGEFFPASIAPFGYNETIAGEYFPLNKQEAIKTGFNWSDYENPIPKVEKIIPASKLPINIKDIPDDVLNWAIECEETKRPFKIIPQELAFYRKHNISMPKRHPDVRHLDRINLRNKRKIYDTKCTLCKKDIKTSFSPESKELVCCQECYNKSIY